MPYTVWFINEQGKLVACIGCGSCEIDFINQPLMDSYRVAQESGWKAVLEDLPSWVRKAARDQLAQGYANYYFVLARTP